MASANQDALIAALNSINVDPADHGALAQALEALNARLPEGTVLTSRTLVPSVPGGAAASDPVAVTGDPTSEFTIIDARSVEHPYMRLDVGYAALLGHSHVYAGAADDVIAGDSANQDITGGAGNDIVFGGGGNDTIFGQEGVDLVYGNQGSDNINGNVGADTILGGRDNDTVLGGQDGDIINGNMGDDLVNGNRGNDEVRGGQGNDEVHGGQDDDQIWGDLGDDSLWGDLGNDIMYGGEGTDRFFFAAGSGRDTIMDFNPGAGERIVLVGRSYTVEQDAAGAAVIVFNADESVTLAGVRRDQFNSDWIISQ